MNNFVQTIKDTLPEDDITASDLAILFPGSEHHRYGLVKRAIAQKNIIPLRRGLYSMAAKHRRKPFNLNVVAQHVYGPSYISFESALSVHGWIPEAVMTTTSACTKRNRVFETPLGMFTYLKIPSKNFYRDTQIIASPAGSYFLARPWKAILDYVYTFKKNWKGVAPLVKSLRIEESNLVTLNEYDIHSLDDYYHQTRISKFLKSVVKDLNL